MRRLEGVRELWWEWESSEAETVAEQAVLALAPMMIKMIGYLEVVEGVDGEEGKE